MLDPRNDRETGTADARPADPRSLADHARRIQDCASSLAAEIHATTTDVEKLLRDEVERRPYRTLAAAAGLGYLVGGGLRSRLSLLLLGLATRLVAAQVLVELEEIAAQPAPRPPASSTSSHAAEG